MNLLCLQCRFFTFLALVAFSFAHRSVLAAQQKPPVTPLGSPLVMRLCIDACDTLTWSGDHYDGVKEKSMTITMHYTVEQWSASGIRLRGKSVAAVATTKQAVGPIPFSSRTYVEGVLTGTIAPDGQSIENAVWKWQIGKLNGESQYKLTWAGDPAAARPSLACADSTGNMQRPAALEVCDGPCILAQDGYFCPIPRKGKIGYPHMDAPSSSVSVIDRFQKSSS